MTKRPKRAKRSRRPAEPWWAQLPTEELLDVRLCDLDLALEGTALQRRVDQLNGELERAGLVFRPYVYLSVDWFTPEGSTGFAVPFYLAHPRLVRLERAQMLEVEGGSRDQCMRLMRHEAGHAIDNAYGLRRKRVWRETFGRASKPYLSSYTPDPTSREHVLNLDYWYSQSHPLEDWAETFAVWLTPGSRWRRRYADWPALRKLEAVAGMMAEVREREPLLVTRAKEEPAHRVRTTLRRYYERKRAFYAEEANPAFDGHLARVFPPAATSPGRPRAMAFLRKHRVALVRRVSEATGQHRYLLDHVVREMVARCRTKDLRVATARTEALVDAAVVLTILSGQFLYGAHPRYQR
ncbi:MAG: hypothetical protein KDC48_16660 [Planctomycetes bacterium]|nr:hypothetical protein [Planctomycetota bacterium]